MNIWVYGHMNIWVYGHMNIWVYGHRTIAQTYPGHLGRRTGTFG